MEKYYTGDQVAKGIDELPPISKVTLRNLRQKRKIKYTKLGNECIYRKSWIMDYLRNNEVEPLLARGKR